MLVPEHWAYCAGGARFVEIPEHLAIQTNFYTRQQMRACVRMCVRACLAKPELTRAAQSPDHRNSTSPGWLRQFR